jgi:hypothetical protein
MNPYFPVLVLLVLLNYALIIISTIVSSIGWFIATESNELLALMPTWVIWIHHTIGVLSYAVFSFLPIMAGSELIMGYMITCLALYFESWSKWFKDSRETSIGRIRPLTNLSAE